MLTMSADLRDYKMNNAYKIKPISHLDFQNIIKRVAVTSSVENQSITIHCKSVDWFLHFWENKVNFSKKPTHMRFSFSVLCIKILEKLL